MTLVKSFDCLFFKNSDSSGLKNLFFCNPGYICLCGMSVWSITHFLNSKNIMIWITSIKTPRSELKCSIMCRRRCRIFRLFQSFRLPSLCKVRKIKGYSRSHRWRLGFRGKQKTVPTHNKHIFVRPKKCAYFEKSTYFINSSIRTRIPY